MSMTGHPDFEELSAYHDGEAPELAAHVAACAACRSRLAELVALSSVVAEQPVPRSSAREQAITSAMAGGSAGPAPPALKGRSGPASARRRGRGWLAVASVAAVLVATLGTVALLGDKERGSDRAVTQLAPTSDPEAVAGGPSRAGPGDIDTAVLGGNLGEVTDAAALATKVGPSLTASNLTMSDSAAAEVSPPPGAARVVGTRPCEIEARENPNTGGLGPVVYVADATRGGTPLVILGFARAEGPSGPGGVTLLAMEQDGCRLLFSSPL